MKRTTIFLFFFFLLLGCKEKDNPAIVDSSAAESGREPDSSGFYLESAQKEEITPEQIDTSDFETDGNGTITWYRGQEKAIVIPAQIDGTPVTAIGNAVIYEYELTSVAIPDSVISIGERTFFDNRLTSLSIPDNVTSIGEGAFADNRETSVTSDRMVIYGCN
jgi:hypothetical protein